MFPGRDNMQKPAKTFADYLVVAISPLLIMLLVGSLAFFLIQVFYRGEMISGVRWVMFWFVLAIVLVARIGIEQSKEHAAFYGVALAIVTWIYLIYIHTTILLGAFLLAVTWFCAHKLTVDCTLIKEDEDASGEGVWESLWRVMEKSLEPPTPPRYPGRPTPGRPTLPTLAGLPVPVALPKKRTPPRAPGRWVVYFSVLALPLFGIGQLFLPADPESRRTGFEFLLLYLAAALSLLMTTSFLGMRRYLRQRFVEMSAPIAVGWVRFGVLLAAAVLILALVFPRPGATSTWHNITYHISHKPHHASPYAIVFNAPGEGEGAPTQHPTEQTGSGTDSHHGTSGGGTQNTQNPGNQSTTPGNSGQSGQGGGGGQSGHGGESGGGTGGGGGGSGERPPANQKIPHANDPFPNGAESDGGNAPVHANDDGKEPQDGNGNGHSGPGQPGNQSHPNPTTVQKPNAVPQQQPIPQPQQKPGAKEPHQIDWQRLLLILFLIALTALLVWLVVRYRRVIAHAFRSFVAAVREFFQKLFSFRRRKRPAPGQLPLPAPPPQPFSTFENPFLTGNVTSWPPKRLILYTYEAIRGWAKDQRIETKPQETPREFCMRLCQYFPDFAPDLERFSYLYGYAAFADELPDDYDSDSIHFLWTYMGDSVTAISAG